MKGYSGLPIRVVWVTALFVGFVYAAPLLVIRYETRPFLGLGPTGFSDETFYVGRLNAGMYGKLGQGNPFIYEHRKDPLVMVPMPELLLSGVSRLSGLSIGSGMILYAFLFTAGLFLLSSLLTEELSQSRLAGITAGLYVLLGSHLLSARFLFAGKIFDGSYSYPLWFLKPISPQFNFLLFFAAMILAWFSLERLRWGWTIASGLAIGVLFYIGVFYWSFIYAGLGVLCLWFLLAGKDWRRARVVCVEVLISLLVSVPYWLLTTKTMRDPNYSYLLQRLDVVSSHGPLFPGLHLLVLGGLIFVWICTNKESAAREKQAMKYMIAFSLGGLLVLNQHVLTGKLFQPSHWQSYTNKTFGIVAVTAATALFLRHRVLPRWGVGVKAVAVVLMLGVIALPITHGIALQSNFVQKALPETRNKQRIGGLIRWINEKLDANSVVFYTLRDPILLNYAPIYTRTYSYLAEPFLSFSTIPFDETQARFSNAAVLLGMDLDEVRKHPYYWDGATFITSDRNLGGEFIAREKQSLESLYERKKKQLYGRLLSQYRIDFIVVENRELGDLLDRLKLDSSHVVFWDYYYAAVRVQGARILS